MHFHPPPTPSALIERITAGEAHVWRARAEALREPLDARCLSAEEIHRANRLRWSNHRDAFIFAHSLKRHVLSKYIATAAGQISFEIQDCGKPAIQHGVEFNLSHCGSAALLAISARFPTGIDLEDCERKLDPAALARACLNDADALRLARVPAEQQHGCLLQWWTRKEALLKAQGCGLARDPREIPVTWPHQAWASCSVEDQGRRWLVMDLPLGGRWRAAVSIEGQTEKFHGFCLGW